MSLMSDIDIDSGRVVMGDAVMLKWSYHPSAGHSQKIAEERALWFN